MSDKYKALCRSLNHFYPDRVKQFMCPVCEAFFSINEKDSRGESKITKAHLIPQAAGGREFTFICKKCNSESGIKQDKWFGEYLQIMASGGSPFNGRTKVQNFKLNDIEINGEILQESNGDISVYIHKGRNNPNNLNKLGMTPNPKSMTVEFPIDKHFKEVYVGALTAAYLSWFNYFGYSWSLQKHLEIIRQQILLPNEDVLPNTYCYQVKGKHWDTPWLGVIEFKRTLCLAYGISNLLVLMPPADQIAFYHVLEKQKTPLEISLKQQISFAREGYPPPYTLLYQRRMLICPDAVKEGLISSDVWEYPGNGEPIVKRKARIFAEGSALIPANARVKDEFEDKLNHFDS